MSNELLPCGFCKSSPISEKNNPLGKYTLCIKCRAVADSDLEWNELMKKSSHKYICKYCNEKVSLYLRHECVDRERIITSEDVIERVDKNIELDF
jgi:hypothetical protein